MMRFMKSGVGVAAMAVALSFGAGEEIGRAHV